MKFLADENIARTIVQQLRKEGFDVKTLQEIGLSDKKVLELALKEERIILTNDKDFAAFHRHRKHKGIILLRLKRQNTIATLQLLLAIPHSTLAEKIPERFTIITDSNVIVHKT